MNTISFRTEENTKRKLDMLAAQQNRDRSYIINQAIDQFLSLYDWQFAHIEEGVRQAQSNEFADETEVKSAFDKWKK